MISVDTYAGADTALMQCDIITMENFASSDNIGKTLPLTVAPAKAGYWPHPTRR